MAYSSWKCASGASSPGRPLPSAWRRPQSRKGRERDQSFAETREEIEKLAQGDPDLYERGGTAGAAQSGEEYRQELRKAPGKGTVEDAAA